MESQDLPDTTKMTASPALSLSILNSDPKFLPGPSLLHQLVRDSSTPGDALDYCAPDGARTRLSYSELHSQAERLATRIANILEDHQGPGQNVVPLLLPQSPVLYISQLAILRAGAAFCPLNLDAPPERTRFILGDVDAKLIVTSTALRHKVDFLEPDVTVLVVDGDGAHHERRHHLGVLREATPDTLAYVMYTSGSTGTPKGVGISHSAATQALLAHDRHIPPFSRFLQFAAPTFDVSIFEIFFPLFRGTTLVCCSRADMLNDLPAVLRDMQVDACELTPTVAGSLLRSRANAPGLQLLLTIGEMLTVPVIREFGGDEHKPSILWAMYGPTEATIHCTIQPSCEASSSPRNVGFPLDTASAFILEPLSETGSGDFKVLPYGQTGELAVGGNQTAVGYVNREEQTSRVFIETPHGRLYRTGDRARMLHNGTIECFGRISDGQVKLRGQRIELGEIEQAVLSTPECRGAVASVLRGIIVVFCEHDCPDESITEDLLRTCRKWLPTFMVPGDFVLQKAFPRLPSGKVNRKKLETDYEMKVSDTASSMSEYSDNVEREMAKVAHSAMGIQLQSSSVLSTAGVDSLAAIKLASCLRQAGFAVTAIDVLKSNTLSDLRSLTPQKSRADSAVELVEQPQASEAPATSWKELLKENPVLSGSLGAIEGILPCTPTQMSMLAETLDNSEAYCNWIELQVLGDHSVDTIALWLRQLADKNEILRTGFAPISGNYKQVIWKELHASQICTVGSLRRSFRLEEPDLLRPFMVQILRNQPRKTSVLLQIHHALYDGWSFDILLADLNLLQEGGLVNGRPSFRLVSDYYQSAGFLHDANAARAYWAEELLNYQRNPMPQLLATKETTGQQFCAERILQTKAPAILNASAQLEVGAQVLFQACVVWLWAHILGTEDVVIGNVTSGRTIPVQGIENVMGPCLTTIPMRSRIKQMRTIRDLLENIHMSNREGLAHCTLPLAEIKKAAALMPGEPLYDVLFVYQESLHSRSSGTTQANIKKVAHEDHLETNLLVEIEPVDEAFRLRVTYQNDAFNHDYVELILGQFDCVLGHIILNLGSETSSIFECFPKQMRSEYNTEIEQFTGCADLATSFERMAERVHAKPALCFAECIESNRTDLKYVTYSELNVLANKVARHIQVLGAAEGAAVAIVMEKSPMLYAGILGILKAGCAYLPLLPSAPPARITGVLKQANVRLCLSDGNFQHDDCNLSECALVNLLDAELEGYDGSNLGTPENPARVANIIYTSGSTGVPKGVSVTQLNITSNLDVLARIYPVQSDSRMLQACSQAFDVSVFEILFALTRGMCLCAARNDILFADIELSVKVMEVTHLSMTPTVASLINPQNVPRVEFLVTSGEPLTSEVARNWMGKLYQGYGPSETTNICSVKKMSPQDQIRHLGHVLGNTSAFVVSPDGLDLLPKGCVGEFCFGGDQVVAGYLNMPGITRDKFIDHPRYGRIYRSGDIGRMLVDGSLLIVGRTDDQVKLRGQRIELGEVSATVALSDEVSNCTVMLVNNGRQLACFYVPRSAQEQNFRVLPAGKESARTKESIDRVMLSRLPGYMAPSYLIPLSTIPMTSSGKIDKGRLGSLFDNFDPHELELFGVNVESGDNHDDWSEDERKIASVVAKALGVRLQQVGRWTPLTSLGLDSISAISVARELQGAFSQKLPISVILQNSSTAKLAALLYGQAARIHPRTRQLGMFPPEFCEEIRRSSHSKNLEVESILRCTPLQEAMLASADGIASYLNKMLFRLRVDPEAMKNYWEEMFQRHAILRTSFYSTEDRENVIAQCILRVWTPDWFAFDADATSLEEAIRTHAMTLPNPVDSGVPPVSLAFIRKGPITYLSFVCHHAMYDGVAMSRLLDEIEQIASGCELQHPPSYRDFLEEVMALPETTDKFWQTHLRGLEPKTLSQSSGKDCGRCITTRVLDMSFSSIERRLRMLNVSLLCLLQATWSSLLGVIQDSDDVCFGNVVNGRSSMVDRVDELVAPCFNTIPARVQLRDKRRNIDLVTFFQDLNPKFLHYQFTPLRRIQASCSKASKLFDTLLLLQQTPKKLNESIWTLERDDGEMDLPLVCEVTPIEHNGDRKLEVKLHFDRVYVPDTAAMFIHDTFSYIISSMLDFPWSQITSRQSLPSPLQARLDRLGLVHKSIRGKKSDLSTLGTQDEWSDSEKAVRTVLSDISKSHPASISRHMTIFQLGLDSINAVQVAASLRRAGFAGATAMDVLENPTCSTLAAKISAGKSFSGSPAEYDMTAFQQAAKALLNDNVSSWESVQAVLPCTPLQVAMLTQFCNSNGKDYFNFISFRFEESIDSSKIAKGLKRLVQSHPILRSGFIAIDHRDVSFAMLQYNFEEAKVQKNILFEPHGFKLPEWQLAVSKQALENLHEPPWTVAVVPGNEGVDMHLAVHHAVYDAFSLRSLMESLEATIYDEPLDTETRLVPVVREIMTEVQRCREDAPDFWRKLAPDAVINKFPVMTPLREEPRSILARRRSCTLSVEALSAAAQNGGFTIQAVAQAAWLRILSSYIGEPSVVFGTVLSGRNSDATHKAVFPCITTLPVIAQHSSSNRVLLQAMMKYNMAVQRHQRTPLAEIQKYLGHPNTRMFDTLLVYQKFDGPGQKSKLWSVIHEEAHVDYPVSIEIEPDQDCLQLCLTFFSDVLPIEQAEILLEQFDVALCDLAEHPDGCDEDLLENHADLFAITPAEQPELVSDTTLLHGFVETSAAKYPNKTALEFVMGFDGRRPISQRWNYKELDQFGNRVANILSMHVKTGDIVAICFEKCPEAHFAMLGILKAGCALLALDPGAPSSRKEFIVRDSGAAVMLTDRTTVKALDFKVQVPVITIHQDSLGSVEASKPKLTRPLVPGDRSYCLYTSGTTGTPKGCEITHENAVQAMLAFQKLFQGHWDESSKWLQFASYHFDVSVLEQYWTWSVGITLVAAPRDVILEDLAGTISRLEITHIDLTPSLARLLHPEEVPSLCKGVFITGGEQLKQEILDVWGPKRVIHNFYGPTEATIGVTTYPCVPVNGRSSNIGRQFANVGSYVLRPNTEIPVLRGGVGELCVSGKLVGKGYLNREELTAERFPSLGVFKERVYRTGDLVRLLHDGCFDFLGRADDQVKLRGQRLEIGEINHCIRSAVPEITDAVTLVIRNDKQQKDLLVSFIVAAQEQAQHAKKLQIMTGDDAQRLSRNVKRACRDKLPGYMVPTYALVLPFIPLSPNNKAEVKELRALFNTLSHEQLVGSSHALDSGDLGETGRKICRALSRIYGVQEGAILPSTSTFELGVDSISAMNLTRGLKLEGFSHVTAAVILKNPVVADLARALQSLQRTSEDATSLLEASQAVQACQHRHKGYVCRKLEVDPGELEYVAPCSPLQHGMISRSRTDGNEGAYFNTFRYDLSNAVEWQKLHAAWKVLVQNHAILRTKFVSTTDGFVQAATKSQEIPWDVVSLDSGHDLETLLAERRQSWIDNNSQNIETPLQFLGVDVNGKRLLAVNIFHGIYDANSFDLMIDEVARVYNGSKNTKVNPPSFLHALLNGPLRNHSFCKKFWSKKFQGVRLRPLPQMSHSPSSQDIVVSRRIEFEPLDKVRKSLGVTHQAIVQGIWISVLHQYCGFLVTIGIIVSGRSIELENVDRTIGPLFNTIPYHHGSTQGQTWASAIRSCHDFNMATLPFQHVPLRDVQKWCSGGAPLFDTLFSFQRASSTDSTSSGLWTEVESNVNADYPLALEATLLPDESLRVMIVAHKGVADEAALEGMADNFEAKAKALVHELDCRAFPDSNVHAAAMPLEMDGPETRSSHPQSEPSTVDLSSFNWSPQADTIRKEVTLLVELEASSITPNTTLLELGLDSIDVIKLSARLRRAGIMLSNSELIRGQSITNFMHILQTKENKGDGIHDSGYSSDVEDSSANLKAHLMKHGQDLSDAELVLPPTPLQDSMVSEMIQSGFQRYFNHDVLELTPQVEVDLLKDAWVTVVNNSPILRTVFIETVGTEFDYAYAQVVLKNSPPAFREVEVDSTDDLLSVMEQARMKARTGHARSDLLQITFAKSNHGSYMILSISHALYDGWSLGLLHKDLELAYHGNYATRPPYAEFLHKTVRSFKQEAKEFWSDYVSDAVPTMLQPQGQQKPAVHVNRAEVPLPLKASAFKEFCRRHAISQQVVAQACWATVLANRSKSLDVVFGVVLSGRDTEASEAMLFPTMNTVPVRAVLHGSVPKFLRYMQENMTGVGQFQNYPLRKIQALIKARQPSLFNTLFIMQKSSIDSSATTQYGKRQPLMRSIESSSAVDYPVCVEMEVSGEEIAWRTACDDGYLSADDTNRLLEDLERVLNYLINSADEDVLQFSDCGVSVCGLPAFQPQNKMSVEQEPVLRQPGGFQRDGVWSDLEDSIRQVLSSMSGIEESSIRKNQNIYHLGLDSISAIKASSTLRQRGIQVGVRDMIQATSISEMATKVCKNSESNSLVTSDGQRQTVLQRLNGLYRDIGSDDLLQSAGIDASDVEEILPATAMQTHMLSVWQNTQGAVFFPEFRYRLSGIADQGTIESSWMELVEMTPALRTVFLSTGRRQMPVLQVILRKTDNPFVSLGVQSDGTGSWVIHLKIHHALYDGISLPLIMRRLKSLLGNRTTLEEPVSTMASWRGLVSSALDGQALPSRKHFWTDYLAGAQSVPLHLPSSTSSTTQNKRVSIFKQAAVSDTSRLGALCSQHGISIQSAFLAAYAKVLSSVSERNDVVFGLYIANRSAEQELQFPTLCLVPLRVKLPPAFDIVDVARAIQRDTFKVSTPENVLAGLWEVKDWTDVVVDSFVNFLSLPEDKSSRRMEEDGVELESIRFDEAALRSENESFAFDPRPASWLEKNVVRDAYPEAVDIEASLGENGGLDIGVFGGNGRLGEHGAEDLLRMIVDLLSI
ncbi:hypothetical protein KVR01_004878 [Diaporthe batatas]|uniref:uncharacterized protein n=1 Tax=Diaporthe batatas TaxID=748121 RepID=UPI001D03723B|nr:uncharacterized protein KVR01_004878 [Diaporthe batatas]KAG8164603.1 hypothetical protein KVR01_004878 [Diaporthe batatas]